MDWPTIRDTLKATVATLTGIAPASVVWKGDLEEGSVVVGTRAVLSTPTIKAQGIDETIYQANGAFDQTVTIAGQRSFTWSIQIEDQNQTNGLTARQIIDRLRLGLSFDSVREAFRTINVCVGSLLNATHRDYVAQGRPISWAVMDIQMLASDVLTDTSPYAGAFINETLVAGTVATDQGAQTVNLDIKGP
jgi:hypothetical protein